MLVADVYAAGESPLDGIHKEALVDGIKAHGHRHVAALESPDHLAAEIAAIAESGDMVICLGAGSVTYWAHDLPAQLDILQQQKLRA